MYRRPLPTSAPNLMPEGIKDQRMAKIVNLRQARKVAERSDTKAKADENAAKFGRSKAQRVLEAAQAKQASDRLSQLKFEDD